MEDALTVAGISRVFLSSPTQIPVPHEGPNLQHRCRSKNPALSACVLEMFLCDSRLYFSCCAPLIILFDLRPKWQVIANKRPELRAVVVNNNTSDPRLTPRSLWGWDREARFIPRFREVVAPGRHVYHPDADFTFISCSSVPAPPGIYLHQQGSLFQGRRTSVPSLSPGPLLHQQTISASCTIKTSRAGDFTGAGVPPPEQLTDKSLLYVPYAVPKLNSEEQQKKSPLESSCNRTSHFSTLTPQEIPYFRGISRF